MVKLGEAELKMLVKGGETNTVELKLAAPRAVDLAERPCGMRVCVFYYPDRVEVHSPGLLLPGITVEQMQRGEVQSKLRNSILADLLRDIPGSMERMGSGIRVMR